MSTEVCKVGGNKKTRLTFQICYAMRRDIEHINHSFTLTEMEEPTSSFVMSWIGLLGSASFSRIKRYLEPEECGRERNHLPLHQ
jgi:hypothetical protein